LDKSLSLSVPQLSFYKVWRAVILPISWAAGRVK
jgi:hypothetical protein